jgi:hypothetical protein
LNRGDDDDDDDEEEEEGREWEHKVFFTCMHGGERGLQCGSGHIVTVRQGGREGRREIEKRPERNCAKRPTTTRTNLNREKG